jgi:DNA-binding protein H-NS
MRGRLLGSWF